MNGAAKLNRKGPNDPKHFISQTSYPQNGEIAQATTYSLNQEMRTQEELFDSLYDLEDDAPAIIGANAGR